jgi:hypothetical protein
MVHPVLIGCYPNLVSWEHESFTVGKSKIHSLVKKQQVDPKNTPFELHNISFLDRNTRAIVEWRVSDHYISDDDFGTILDVMIFCVWDMVTLSELCHYSPDFSRDLPRLRYIWTSAVKTCLPNRIVILDFCVMDVMEEFLASTEDMWHIDLWDVENRRICQLVLDPSLFESSETLVLNLVSQLGKL